MDMSLAWGAGEALIKNSGKQLKGIDDDLYFSFTTHTDYFAMSFCLLHIVPQQSCACWKAKNANAKIYLKKTQ